MAGGFCRPNGFTFSCVLSDCAASGEWEIGRAIHSWVLKCDVKDDIFVGTCIVDLYAKCGDMGDAVREFSRMPDRNVVSWTAMISGFVQREDASNAIKVFKEMIQSRVEVNKYTLTSVLLACAKSFMVKETMQIHCWTWKNGLLFMDSVVKETFISTYARIGNLQMSDKIFEEMGLAKSFGTWLAMISGLAQNHNLRRSAELFKRMFHEGFKPDKKCTSSVLSIVDNVEFGRQIHSYVVKIGLVLDVLVGSSLFTMYSKCGSIEDSYELFTQMNERDRVSWTSMISGFAAHGFAIKALQLFREMILEGILPDQRTLSAVLMACYDQFLMQGKEIHAHALREGLESETLVGSSLVSMYCKCKDLASSRRVFDGTPCKDQAVWSSLDSGYSAKYCNKAALSRFHCMIISGFGLDHIVCSSVLGACADLLKPILGKQLHAHAIKEGFIFHLSVSSALVTMYSKSGSINDSLKVFDEIEHPDLVTWSALIDGYAQHGRGLEALDIFQKMKQDGVKPDSLTYLSILSACNHNGLVEEGFFHFNSMRSDYGIEPEQNHYASVVDLLGRSGRLKEAANFIDKMPLEPNWVVWNALLGACRVHGDVELGRLAFKKVVELEPHDSGAYISASNISAEVGDWEEVVRIRSSMQGVGIKKEPGWSFV
nr:pentatricopeptide repeat protein AaPPR788 [Agave angustifolia]